MLLILLLFFLFVCFQMIKLCSQLEMIVLCYEAKRDKLKETKELIFKETKDKIQKMKLYQDRLMESLGEILEKHVPAPPRTEDKKKHSAQDVHVEFISLNEILELLMNKLLTTPHDPYVDIDATFWPPYVEMLLRYGVAIRHQENNFKIRLEPFC
uniref:Uncharacterized protein n=1 Tax=Periophthalmus magnuspinnatus TaxID=409849 RepID=A0A3B4BIT5_9GOBI